MNTSSRFNRVTSFSSTRARAVFWTVAWTLGFFLLLPTPSAFAAKPDGPSSKDEGSAPQTTVEGEIVVTSTIPELATSTQISGSDVSGSGKADVAGYLRGVAGLEAVRRGTINLDPVVRGLQEGQIGMFVDGTRTFAAGPARMDSDLSHVAPNAVRNLQIVKGPYALTWGSGTLSAIQLETFKPDFRTSEGLRWAGTLGASYAENSEAFGANGAVWGSGERLRFFLGAGHRAGSDFEAGDGSAVPGDYGSTDGRWRFGYLAANNVTIDYSGGYQEQFDLDYPGRLLDATYFYTRSHAVDVAWFGEGRVAEVSGKVYVNRKDHRMNNDEKPTAQANPNRIPPFPIDVDLPTESNTTGGRVRVGLRPGDATNVNFGVDYYEVEQTASRTVSRRTDGRVLFQDIVWPEAEIEDLGAWVQVLTRRGKAQIGATLRLDEVDARAGELSPFFVANTIGDPDQSESNVSAAVSALVELSTHWTLDIGLGRAVRSANVLERYSDRFPSTKFQSTAEFMGNPLLDPEESLELDIGLRGRFGDFLIQIDTFYREIDDYITVAPDPTLPRRLPLSPPVVFRYINGDKATFYGGELLLQQQATPRVAWHGQLSYVWAEDEAFDEPVLGIAPLHGEVGLRLTPITDLSIDATLRFADRQDRVATARFEQETPGWTVYDLAASYRFDDRWRLFAGVENLTDHAYTDHLNAPNPFSRQRVMEIGRNVRLGLELTF